MNLNWCNPKSPLSRYFSIGEVTFLPQWNVYHIPNESEKLEIMFLAMRLDQVREFLGLPIVIHCWIRPTTTSFMGKLDYKLSLNSEVRARQEEAVRTLNYNLYIGSTAKNSAHIRGAGVDFHVKGFKSALKCAEIRKKLLPKLEELGLRMEDINGDWIHLDTYPVKKGGRRFFKP
jgi:hypothetical protein